MIFDWQNVCVGLIIAAAVVYLARRLWQRVRATQTADCATGCGKCDNNPAPNLAPQPVKRVVLVELQGRQRNG